MNDNDFTNDNRRAELRRLLGRRAVLSLSPRSELRIQPTTTVRLFNLGGSIFKQNAARIIVVIMGGGVGIQSYRSLATRLTSDAPRIAAQFEKLDPESKEVTAIESMAQLYSLKLLEELPQAEFAIVGHSLAGNVAVEVCRKLQEAGRKIAFAGIIDQPGPDIRMSALQWLRWQWTAVSHLPGRQRWSYLREGVRFRLAASRFIPHRIREWIVPSGKSAATGTVVRSQSINQFRRQMLDASLEALRNYRPGPVDFPLLLIRARSGAPRIHADPYGGWKNVARGPLTVVDVPGHHMNMFNDENLPRLAEALEAAWRMNEKGSPSGLSPE